MRGDYLMTCFVLLSLFLVGVSSFIHNLKLKSDTRKVVFVESFGFDSGGQLHINISEFHSEREKQGFGFLFYKTTGSFYSPASLPTSIQESEREDTEDENQIIEESLTQNPAQSQDEGQILLELIEVLCKRITDDDEAEKENEGNRGEKPTLTGLNETAAFPSAAFDFFEINTELAAQHQVKEKGISRREDGLYYLFFLNCLQPAVTFKAKVDMHNVGPNYLPVGEIPLPFLFTLLFFLYTLLTLFWSRSLFSNPQGVRHIHFLLTIFFVTKTLSLLFRSVELHYLQLLGVASGWDLLYYLFACLKGILMFVAVALIGTGWTIFKSSLSDLEKKIFVIVIALQVIGNIFVIIMEENAMGSENWLTSRNVFIFLDFFCCAIILMPITWSIKHLEEAALLDGKAAKNLTRLKFFRQFYLAVVSYIYFTRIVVFALDVSLSYKLEWLIDLFVELAGLIFYIYLGYRFLPDRNPLASFEEE